MKQIGRALLWLTLSTPIFVSAQIDPVKRDLIQLGYNAAFEGHAPFAGYAFYYHNQPDFLRTNLTLRLSLAPVYLIPNSALSAGWGRIRTLPSVWRAAVSRTVTRRFATASIILANPSTAMAAKFQQASIICSIPPTRFR